MTVLPSVVASFFWFFVEVGSGQACDLAAWTSGNALPPLSCVCLYRYYC